MIQICRKDKKLVYEAIRSGNIDAAEMSIPNLVDDILLTLKRRGLTAMLSQALTDKRRENFHIPFDILLCLAVAAKLKGKTSLTDVPFAITDAELLAELGWNLWDNERDINDGLFSESVMRKLLAKYSSDEWVSSVVKIDGETMRGYKLGVLRGVLDDSGVAEEIVFGTLKTHDMEQCRDMLRTTSFFMNMTS